MADISHLGNLNSSEPLDLSQYADVKAGFSLPKKGRYTVRAPESFPATAFGSTRNGDLSVQIDPTIVGPSNEGYTIRFTKVSAKPFKRSGMSVSQLGDYLRATGSTAAIPGDPQGQADAVEATAGLTYQVDVDWRAYNKNTGFVLEGMENFPKGKDGQPIPVCTDPEAKDENGEPVRLRANLQVTRFVPAGA